MSAALPDDSDGSVGRVLHVIAGPQRHGVTRHALETVEALRAGSTGTGMRHEIVRILTDDQLRPDLDSAADEALGRLTPADPGATFDGLVHLHLTDHLLGTSATRCADRVVALAERRPVSLSLHDLPQPETPRDPTTEGDRHDRCDRAHPADADCRLPSDERPEPPGRYERRRLAYARMAAHARGIVVASEHERDLLRTALRAEGLAAGGPIEVVPLPLASPPASAPDHPGGRARAVDDEAPRDLVVFGYLYPGKGHAAALDALACLAADGAEPADELADVGLLALGGPSPGHAGLVEELADRARELGRRFAVTGYLPEAEVTTRLRGAAVPVAAAEHVSASGSIGSWLAAGRRPLVPSSPYVDELEARCPGALLRYGPGLPHPTLAAAVRAALADPRLTWLADDVRLGPDADACAARLATVLCDWTHAMDVTDRRLGVVVTHYDDQRALDRVLTVLDRGTRCDPGPALRVVVADDGSPSAPVLGERRYDVQLVRQEDRGFRAAAARNLGARTLLAAGVDLLVFLDGDTTPEPGFVAELSRATREAARRSATGRALGVGRRRYLDFSDLDTDASLDLVADVGHLRIDAADATARLLPDPAWLEEGYAATHDLSRPDDRSYRFVLSAVLAMTRELFEAVDGFDESFVGYGGEDWDLANRCYLAGAEFVYAPRAVAWHDGPDAGRRAHPAAGRTATPKSRETLRLAHVITEPGARDPGLLWEIPDIAVDVDDHGWTVEDTLLTCADLVRGSDARVWLRDGLVLTDGVWPPGDPRVQIGPVPERVLARARYRVTVTRPVRLAVPLSELVAAGPADHVGVRIERTRDVALRSPRPDVATSRTARPQGSTSAPMPSSPAIPSRSVEPSPPLTPSSPSIPSAPSTPVTQATGDRRLEAEWGWRRKELSR